MSMFQIYHFVPFYGEQSCREGGGNGFGQTPKSLNQFSWHSMGLGMLSKERCDVKVQCSAHGIPGESPRGVTILSAHPSWDAVPLVKPQETQQQGLCSWR